MRSVTQRVTTPVIVRVDQEGPEPLTRRVDAGAAQECLLVIYPRPTVRQARIQLWMSVKMLLGAMGRGGVGYLKRINGAHDTVWRRYAGVGAEEKRSSGHGNA